MTDTRAYRCDQQEAVASFHRSMSLPAPPRPTALSAARADLRCRLIEEEAAEYRAATFTNNWTAMIDALVDLLYVTYGTAVEMGVDLQPFFDEVHAANMHKRPPADGGKAVKGSEWQQPDIGKVYSQVYGEHDPFSINLQTTGTAPLSSPSPPRPGDSHPRESE